MHTTNIAGRARGFGKFERQWRCVCDTPTPCEVNQEPAVLRCSPRRRPLPNPAAWVWRRAIGEPSHTPRRCRRQPRRPRRTPHAIASRKYCPAKTRERARRSTSSKSIGGWRAWATSPRTCARAHAAPSSNETSRRGKSVLLPMSMTAMLRLASLRMSCSHLVRWSNVSRREMSYTSSAPLALRYYWRVIERYLSCPSVS